MSGITIKTGKSDIGSVTMPSRSLVEMWHDTTDLSRLLPIIYFIGIGQRWTNIFEIGTGDGYSTSTLNGIVAKSNGRLFTVDIVSKTGDITKTLSHTHFMTAHSTNDKDIIYTTFTELGMNYLDCLFIDGDHTPEQMLADFNCYIDLLHPGGFVLFHDVCLNAGTHNQGHAFWIGKDFPGFEHLTLDFSNGLGMLRKK